MNKCSRCGTEIPTGAHFCLACGRDVSRPSGRTQGDHQEGGETTSTGTQVTLIANSIWPLNRGGLRPTVAWTVGLEYNF